MTQIELLSCPFCGETLEYRAFNDAHFHATGSPCVIAGVIVWAERRKAWNTRSDTREQATASPSAVGEGQAPTEQQLWDLLRGTCYLDPPDGGDVPLLEQLIRMSADAAKYRALSSQAPPSAVGEGHDFETQQIMIADPRKFIVTHVYKVKRDGWQRVDSYQCASAESARILLEMLTRSLSSQAPKPASAGGEPIPPFEPTNAMSTAGKHYMKGQEELFERQQAIGCWRVMYRAWQESISSQAPKPASAGGWRSVLCPALLYPTLRKWLDEDSAKKAAEQVACALYDAFIAAEANTAKEQRKYRCRICRSAIVYHEGESCDSCCPPAADRLAPIEARGVVTDAMLQAARNAWIAVEVPEGIDDDGEESFTVHLRHAILAALRARESAPAVEK